MTNPAELKIDSKTWMLFESGNGVAVNLSLYPLPKDSNRPIDAYVVTETAGDFTKSARRAAAAVYDVLQHRFPHIPQKVVGFDLQGYSRATTGESGGLAFAIALAKKLLNQDPGPVAATGEIISGHHGGQLGPIKGIVEKFKAAEQLLPENGSLFYPQQNDAEISDELRKPLIEKGIRLHPVSSVSEVLALFFGWDVNEVKSHTVQEDSVSATFLSKDSAAKKKQTTLWPLLVLFIVAAGVTVWFYFPKSDVSKDTGSDQIAANPSQDIENTPKTKLPESDVDILNVPKIRQTVPLSTNLGAVNFKGDSSLANELAELLNEKLTQILADENISLSESTVSGVVKIFNIKEEEINDQGDFRSSMVTVLSQLSTNINDTPKSYPDIRITIQNNGQIKSLLPLAEEELSNKIENIINQTKIDKTKGFD